MMVLVLMLIGGEEMYGEGKIESVQVGSDLNSAGDGGVATAIHYEPRRFGFFTFVSS